MVANSNYSYKELQVARMRNSLGLLLANSFQNKSRVFCLFVLFCFFFFKEMCGKRVFFFSLFPLLLQN